MRHDKSSCSKSMHQCKARNTINMDNYDVTDQLIWHIFLQCMACAATSAFGDSSSSWITSFCNGLTISPGVHDKLLQCTNSHHPSFLQLADLQVNLSMHDILGKISQRPKLKQKEVCQTVIWLDTWIKAL